MMFGKISFCGNRGPKAAYECVVVDYNPALRQSPAIWAPDFWEQISLNRVFPEPEDPGE